MVDEKRTPIRVIAGPSCSMEKLSHAGSSQLSAAKTEVSPGAAVGEKYWQFAAKSGSLSISASKLRSSRAVYVDPSLQTQKLLPR